MTLETTLPRYVVIDIASGPALARPIGPADLLIAFDPTKTTLAEAIKTNPGADAILQIVEAMTGPQKARLRAALALA